MAISSSTTSRSESTSSSGSDGRSSISASRSKASSVCSSNRRACSWVDSLLVAALVAAPMPSKSSEISIAEWRSVPLNSRCSRKCETPACAGASSREPVRTQRPSATERTEGTTSVITRRPPLSSVEETPSGSG